MPVFQSRQLLEELSVAVHHGLTQAAQLRDLSPFQWQAPVPGSQWSPAQHLHHLNFYADFYTRSIANSMDNAKAGVIRPHFRAGWLGNYFTRIIGPAPAGGELKMKMKSPANAVPPAATDLNAQQQLDNYLAHQRRLLDLLQRAQSVDLGRNRAATSLSPWIRLKLGDTFRFVVAHQQRHFQKLDPLLVTRQASALRS
jgi:hypothetical protein